MAKKKTIDLPPSGVDLGVSEQKSKGKPKGGCRTQVAAAVVFLCGLSFLGSLMPKTPEQISKTETAVIIALAAADVVKPTLASPENSAMTDTPADVPTAVVVVVVEPSATITDTVTPYPDVTMTATIPPTFQEEESSLKELPGVISVESIERRGTDYFAVVTTHPNFNKESFASLIQTQAIKVDIYTFRFAVRIDDGGSEPLWWIYDDKTFEWSSSKNPPDWVDLSLSATQSTAANAPQTIAVQSTDSKTYYASSGGTNVRSCPKTSCDVVIKIAAGEAIVSDGYVNGDAANTGNTIWYRVMVDGKEAYIYSGVVTMNKPSTTTTNSGSTTTSNNTTIVIQQSVPTAASEGFVCPSNCDGAVAMGLSPQQAAACGMDRDGDGVACYGD